MGAADFLRGNNKTPESKREKYEYFDYIVLELAREFGNKLAFKGGYMLTKLIAESARSTVDVDFSIITDEIYEEIKVRLSAICDKFISDGIIDSYEIKQEIFPRRSGGVVMYKDGVNVMGVDVGWHDLTYGVTTYNIDGHDIQGFTVDRMISDKITAILSRKRFRRAKDLYDVYVISSSFNVDMASVMECIRNREESSGTLTEWSNYPFTEVILKEYKKAYDSLVIESVYMDRLVEKPTFEEVYERFSTFVECLLRDVDFVWDYSRRMMRRK